MNKKVRIVADSASDMLPDEAEQLGVTLIPLTVNFNGEEFYDGLTISRDEFYNRLIESDVIPKTSQITPQRYEDVFAEAIANGEEVVCLVMSSGISGSYQSARIAQSSFEKDVYVVDTQQFCAPEYLLIKRAVEFRDSGMSAKEIADAVEKEKSDPIVIALFDTLEYLKLGGRLPAAAAMIGGLLSIKPVVTIENGGVSVVGKARGSKNGNNYLVKYITEHGGVDWDKPVLLSYTGNSTMMLEKYVQDSIAVYEGRNPDDVPRSRVGCTIGTYAGPGAIAFSFFPKKK